MSKASGSTRASSASDKSHLAASTIASFNQQESDIRRSLADAIKKENLVDTSKMYSEEAYRDSIDYINHELDRLPKEELSKQTTFESVDNYLHTVISVENFIGSMRVSGIEASSYDAIKYLHGKALVRKMSMGEEKARNACERPRRV